MKGKVDTSHHEIFNNMYWEWRDGKNPENCNETLSQCLRRIADRLDEDKT